MKKFMNNLEFESFVMDKGSDILRFCIIVTGSRESGQDLYQSTMLKLLEIKHKLDNSQNVKGYALSVAINLQRNTKKKWAIRTKIAPTESISMMQETGKEIAVSGRGAIPEMKVLEDEQMQIVRDLVAELPEKYRIPIYLFYSADMKICEISKIINAPESTVKTYLRRGKQALKVKLEAIGYDR